MPNPTPRLGLSRPAEGAPDWDVDVNGNSDLIDAGVALLVHTHSYIPNSLVDARGDLLTATSNDTPARLAVGADGLVLSADSAEATGLKWITVNAAAGTIPQSLLDAKGDLIVASAADTAARLAVGTNGQLLTADSAEATGMKWADAPSSGISPTILDAKGDIIAATAADTPARLAVGTNGQALLANSATATGLEWGTAGITGQGAGTNSVLVGDSATASADQSVALGDFAVSSIDGGIAIGSGTNATSAAQATTGQGAIAIGVSNAGGVSGARASGISSVAIGSGDASVAGAAATGQYAIAIGILSAAGSNGNGIAIGSTSTASGASAVSIGNTSTAAGTGGVAVGTGSSAAGSSGVCVGSAATLASACTDSVSIGHNARGTTSTQTIAIGGGQNTTAGPLASAQGAIAIGASNGSAINGARASGAGSVAIGSGDVSNAGASASGSYGVALGNFTVASSTAVVAIGAGAAASTAQSVALGEFAAANTGTQAVAIGGGTNATAAPQATAQGAIAIGASNGGSIAGARASGTGAVAIGSGDSAEAGASATGYSIAIGRLSNAAVASSGNIAIGYASAVTVATQGGMAIGTGATVNKTDGIAIGRNAVADQTTSVAIGTGANTTADNQIMLGTSAEAVAVPGTLAVATRNVSGAPYVVHLNTGLTTCTDAPAAVQEFANTAARRVKADLTGVTRFRVSARVTTAGVAGFKIAPQYSTDDATWKYLGSNTASGSAPSAGDYVAGDAIATAASSFTNLTASAKADVFIRLVTLDGDGAADPVVGIVALQVQ